MWHQLEPVYASLYFAPEAFEEAKALGYDVGSRWPGYFAYRGAPLGAAGPELVTATFHSFSPHMVAEYVPAAWETAGPGTVLAARLRAVDRILRGFLGDAVTGPEMTEAAGLARTAAESADMAARPLAAANRELPWPKEPHLALWQAMSVLREHRGDGHLAALLAAGLDGCETLVSFAAIGAVPVENFAGRGWSEEEWAAAQDRLFERGWVDADGHATDLGRKGREDIERLTDELAAAPWRALGAERCERFARLLHPAVAAVFESGILPPQPTLGIATVRAPGPR
ncbi:SCO6745 family protein [Streptomyces gobiensis]|uniref:SCO6745 family protein n=1 Tax=Streptomyces gobiensis TaxID=2875706 RepID=UPI001E2A5F90|nr:hypothetical protein [Streptomyces gobiensis]UGY94953.1 hypothetical protein test1122_01040 [Streptomyces gobiensis]